jgi:hypothetical protein
MSDETPTDTERSIGWPRAVLTAVIIVVVGFGVLVYGANALLTRAHDIRRSALVGIVTPLFFIGLLVLAWVLRVLQRRNVI